MPRCFLKVFAFLLLPAFACAQPNAAFTFTEVCLGNATTFTNTSTATAPDTIIAWKWNFGDGDSVTVQEPTHVYDAHGIYSVRLIVTTVNNLRDTVFHDVEVHPFPVAGISANPFTGCQPLEIQFTNNTTIDTGSFTSLWDFDDGTTSTQQNPTHTFWELFIHTVQLTVTSNKGCVDSTTRDIFVLQNPVCDFTASLVSLNDSSPVVYFTNLSSGGNIDLLWDFGDGDTSTEYSLQHTYDTCGTYNVILTATGTNTCVTVANYILQVCDTLVQIYNSVESPPATPGVALTIFPNPSDDGNITVSYELDKEETVSCIITDITGKLVAAPLNRQKQAKGNHSIEWKEALPAGIYFLVFDVSGSFYSKKIIVR